MYTLSRRLYLASALSLALSFSGVSTAESLSIPALKAAQRPALIYSENAYGTGDTTLYAAYREKEMWQHHPIVTGIYLALEPLDGARFVLTVGASSRDCSWYVVDFGAGTAIQPTMRRGENPTTFERPGERFMNVPERGVAHLLQDAPEAATLELISLDYNKMTWNTTPLPKRLFKEPFDSGVRLRMAPDGKRIAYLEAGTSPHNEPEVLRYRLQVLDAGSMESKTVDDEVFVRRAPNAPTPFAWPAFAWLDATRMLYVHMDQAPGGAMCTAVFKTADVETGAVSEAFHAAIPMGPEGGMLLTTPQGGLQYFVDGRRGPMFDVNLGNGSVLPATVPAALQFERTNGQVRVTKSGQVLLDTAHFAGSMSGLLSPSGQAAAFSLSTPDEIRDRDRQSDLFVSLDGAPAMTIAPTIYYRKPLAWVE